MTPSARASILVLDDDDGFRRFLVDALHGDGYSVVDSGDANAVLTILDGSIPFDLLITDIKMPRFQAHGIAVGNMAMLKRHGIKIIYVTGDPTQVPRDFIDTAETPLLGKPIRLELLLETVATVLGVGKRPIDAREPGMLGQDLAPLGKVAMEQTFADIEADIASLRANAIKYRKLAEDGGAAGHFMVAEKLMELLAELEAKLGAFARSRGLGSLIDRQ